MTTPKLHPGIYQIESFYDPERSLDLAGPIGRVVIWSSHNGDNQKWEIKPLGDGYSIRGAVDGRYVSFEPGSLNGAKAFANKYPVAWDVRRDESGPRGAVRLEDVNDPTISSTDFYWRLHFVEMGDVPPATPSHIQSQAVRGPVTHSRRVQLQALSQREDSEDPEEFESSFEPTTKSRTVMNTERLASGEVTITTTTTTTATTVIKGLDEDSFHVL